MSSLERPAEIDPVYKGPIKEWTGCVDRPTETCRSGKGTIARNGMFKWQIAELEGCVERGYEMEGIPTSYSQRIE